MKPIHHIRILKRLRGGLGTAVLLGILIPQLALANPLGPKVVSGQASFTAQGKTLSVTNSDRAIINWQDFSIAGGEITRFIQPTATSAVLNRVVGNNPSAIYGALQSNGRVYLVNANGIFIGPTATIDVNGLVASTLNISDSDFKAGRINFSGGPLAGRIENQGAIRTPAGGSIYLIAPDITNSGVINAPNGDILLAAGRQVSLVESTTPEIAVVVSAPGNEALNLGRIIAEAGRIGIYGGLIRHRGIVSADSAVMDKTGAVRFRATKDITFDKDSVTTANGPKGGSITVQSTEGTTLVSGAVEAKGSSDRGGTIQLLGRHVGVIDAAQIDASGEQGGGMVLVGGDYQGKNPDVQNADRTYFGTDAIIRADASANGDGGKVILWGNEATRAYGSISARGGELSGNGGLIETSGHYLDVAGAGINASALKGNPGTWLLDPYDVTIATGSTAGGSFSGGSPDIWTPDDISSNIDPTVISGILDATTPTNVIVNTGTTGDGGPGLGNISVLSPITWDKASSLTLNANNNISINATITGTHASATLTLNAPGSISQGAAVQVSKLELLGGGAYTLNNTSNSIGTLAGSVGSLSLQNNGPLTIGMVNGNGGLSATGNVTLTALTDLGNININGVLIYTDTGVVTLNAGGTINETTVGDDKGGVWAATLNTTSNSGQSLDGGNEVSSFSATNTGSGAISLVNTAPGTVPANTLTVTGITQAAGQNISVNNTGNINITGTIGGGAVTNLTADGTISQSGAGIITTTGLVANATNGITLNGNNILTNFSGSITSGGGGEAGGSIELKNVGAGVITIGNITNDTTGLLEADSGITINSIGGININGLISTASGGVSLVSSAGPITAVSAVPKHVTGYYLSADAIGGIGTSVSPLKTSISTLDATIASAAPWGDIVITNTGALNINTLVSNGSGTMGGGKILINNTGSITTGVNLVRGYGDVTIIANSPLTIGTGGVTSNTGNITLTAGATGLGVTTDIMNINGPVNAAAGNIVLSAGNTINVNPPDGNLNCLGLPGCVSKTENLNGEAPPPTPTCPTGQQLVGGICQPITCPTGYHLVGSTCQAITCPTGQQLVGNTCQAIICPAGQELVGNLCQPIACPGGKVWAAGGCQCPAGTIDYAGVCKTPSIVPGTDSSTVIYFPITEELTEPLQVLVKSIINTVDPSLFRTSGSPAGGAGDDLKPKKNYCN